MLTQAAHTAFHLVNMAWVGRLGASSTAALTTAFFLLWTLYALADVAAVGITATVSRHVGAGERDGAAHAAAQGLVLACGLGVALAVLGAWGLAPLLSRIGLAPDVLAIALSYLRIAFAAAPLSFVYVACEAVLRASGDTRTPFKIIACSLGLNALLDPLLIFGPGPFPRLGVEGAAIATVVAQAVAVAWFLRLAARGHAAFPLARRALGRPEPRFLGALATIGAPFAMIGILYSVVYLFFAWVTARFGTGPVAILGVGNRIESVVYLVAAGFGLACETLVGQNLGARQPERAERAVWIAGGLIGAFGTTFTLAMLLAPRAFLALFLSDAAVIAQGVPYVRILAWNQAFAGLELVVNGGFSGSGDTRPPMLISVVVSLLRLPLTWWFAVRQGGGLTAVAWVITLTCVARGLVLAAWFRRGRWKMKALETARFEPAPGPHPLPSGDPTL